MVFRAAGQEGDAPGSQKILVAMLSARFRQPARLFRCQWLFWMGTNPIAALVMAIDFAASFSVPIIARIASTFSMTTSASWWIAWKKQSSVPFA
jgi:hypothetical protein